jgi:predicted metal-binding membrane protein
VAKRTPIEALLLRDRWLVGGALAAAVVVCWAWIVPLCVDMYGRMSGAAAWMMPRAWDRWHLFLLFAMWAVMMAGMMLPSAAPAVLLYGGVIRKSPESARTPRHVNAFAGGYVLVWTLFSLAATGLQRLLSHWLLLSPMMETRDRHLGAGLLLLAGLYQLTPWKNACLRSCRSPAEFLVEHWRPGVAGGFWMGWTHGLLCLGCCWALMLLLFVGGVMNLWWIAGLTIFVLLEKLAPWGDQGGKACGLALVAAGAGLWFAH